MREASLPTYILPPLPEANACLWHAMAALLRADGVQDVPEALTTGAEALGPNTLFSQLCGYPLRTLHPGGYQLLGIPHYDAPGCDGATHRAFLLVRAEDPADTQAALRGCRFALNSWHSNTGMNLPRHLLAPLAVGGRFFGQVLETGSHAASMAAVQAGRADAASVDAVTFAFHGEHAPATVAGLRILCETAPSPAIPFVTTAATSPADTAALRRALHAIGADAAYAALRARLRLRGIGPPEDAAYDTLLRYQDEAARHLYPVLA